MISVFLGATSDITQCPITQGTAVDLQVTVLTSTFWPGESAPEPCTFPPDLTKVMQKFEQFYHRRHSGRSLKWQAHHGTADIRVAFKNKKHELNVSTHCMVILLLFENLEDGEELGLAEISAATQIPNADLARSLQSLACGKYRILNKLPRSKDIRPKDKFSFNTSFTCPLARIKIQTVMGKVETKEESAETQERIDEERKHQIEVSQRLFRIVF